MATGSVNQKVLPFPTSLSTPIFPPWARTISRAIVSPSPDPPDFPPGTWKNFSKIRSRNSGGMPSFPCLSPRNARSRPRRPSAGPRCLLRRMADRVHHEVGEHQRHPVQIREHRQIPHRRAADARGAGSSPPPSSSPTPTPGPGGSPTPTPTASADPGAPLPTDVTGLIEYANTHFAAAQSALRAGDFARYGIEMERVQAALNALDALTPGLGQSPVPSASPAP